MTYSRSLCPAVDVRRIIMTMMIFWPFSNPKPPLKTHIKKIAPNIHGVFTPQKSRTAFWRLSLTAIPLTTDRRGRKRKHNKTVPSSSMVDVFQETNPIKVLKRRKVENNAAGGSRARRPSNPRSTLFSVGNRTNIFLFRIVVV